MCKIMRFNSHESAPLTDAEHAAFEQYVHDAWTGELADEGGDDFTPEASAVLLTLCGELYTADPHATNLGGAS